MLSYPESKGKHWEAQWWAGMQGGKKQHQFHFCSPWKVSPKEPKADSWGTGECWTAGALLMAQPATTSRLRSGTAPVGMLDFLLILLLIFLFFLPSPSRTCRGVLWAGVTSRAPISSRTWPTWRVRSPECPTEPLPAVSVHDPAPVMLSKTKSPTLFYLVERTLPSSLLSSVTPDALLQSCPSLNQLVSGSVNVTAHLLQQQSPDVGGRLAGEKRKKNPSSQKKNPSSQPCCCSNQAPSCLLLSNMALCPSSPWPLFNPCWLMGIRDKFAQFPAGLVPSVTQCEQSPSAAQGDGTLSCCSLQKMNCPQSTRSWAFTLKAGLTLVG